MSDINSLCNIKLVIFDFDGVFTDNSVIVSESGIESVRCWRSDGLGLNKLRRLGIKMAIVSTEKNIVVQTRAQKLNIPCFSGVNDKAEVIRKISLEWNVPLSLTMFVGNDINDIPAFQLVGYPVAVADSYPEINPYIHRKTVKGGGMGAVREICDLISDEISKIQHEN